MYCKHSVYHKTPYNKSGSESKCPKEDEEILLLQSSCLANWESHFGENCIIHRKGATSAREGEVGIIPGSQRTSSYIVEDLGNPLSFMSCSHGAGRIMSRTEAVKTLNLAEEIQKLDEKGIVHAIRSQEDLEEASAAYKDIELVMAQESDLVKIKTHLLPIAVIKG